MKILVALKCVMDQQVRVKLTEDGSKVDLDHAPMVMNHFDAIALEQAIRWRESGLVTEVLAVSIGSAASQNILQQALAMGATDALLIHTDQSLEPLNIAKILQFVVHTHNSQMVLLGKQATDLDQGQTGAILAGCLQWPQVTCAAEIKWDQQNSDKVEVISESDDGLITTQLILPAVITVDLRLNQPRYPTLPQLLKAKRQKISAQDLAALPIVLKSHVKVRKVAKHAKNRLKIQIKNISELKSLLLRGVS